MTKRRRVLENESQAGNNGKMPVRSPGLSKNLGTYKLGSEMDHLNLRDLGYEDSVEGSDS